ncbi:MAG TPA: penicillin-binding transpeptidase domain-containing protein, partial [Rhodocyclaceae bacterium]|nr:penicillin-binding transpeptidase domain-containing protein [Rhodocyclaceae bacterium]
MEFKPPEQELSRFRARVAAAAIFALVCFVLIISRFFYLQVIRHDYFATRAEDNRISLVPVVPNRGLIIDSKGVVLARNYSAYTLEITPGKVQNLDAVIDDLSEVIEIQQKDRKRFKKLLEESKNFESLPIRTRLTDEEVARFVAQRYRFPGVDIKARLFRQYPFGAFASHALGYIGRINAEEMDKIDEDDDISANYRGTEHIGKWGLEQSYESELHGTTGFEQVEVDASGRAVRALSRIPPIPGNNLVLTLDAELQRIAEQAFGDRRGALVAIDPNNGGILALVSTPQFDPNLFVDGIDSQNWNALNTSIDHPLLNRAIYSAYPPGSTFKPYMALAALESGKRTASQTIYD